MSESREVRLAIVGVGHLGRHHARVAASLPGVACVGIHDHHDGRAEAVGKELGLPVLPTLDAVADAAEGVIVATPTESHAEIAAYFLGRGRDVLIEKPITANLSDADRILALAKSRGRIVQVGHVERYNPAVGAALSMVTDVRFVEVHRLGSFTERSLDVDVVLDLMIHDLEIVRLLARHPPVEVRAAGVPVLSSRIDIANARILFDGGCVANLTASRVSTETVRKCRIFAPSLYLSIDMLGRSVKAFGLSRDGGGRKIVSLEVPVPREEPLVRELSDFSQAVRERKTPLVSGEVGRDALALAVQVLEAIEEHRRGVEGVLR